MEIVVLKIGVGIIELPDDDTIPGELVGDALDWDVAVDERLGNVMKPGLGTQA